MRKGGDLREGRGNTEKPEGERWGEASMTNHYYTV